MILDDLYIALRDRLLDPTKPNLGIKTIDWNKGQAEQMEQSEGVIQDPLLLPAVLIRYEPPEWKARGHQHYEAEGVFYLDVVQSIVDDPLTSDRDAALVASTRATYDFIHEIAKRPVRMRGVGYGTVGLIGYDQDHDFTKIRVDTIALRSLLSTDMDPATYVFAPTPALVIDGQPTDPPVQGNEVRVFNSDLSIDERIDAPGELELPDEVHIDSDGTPVTVPALTPFIATACVAPPPCLPVTVRDTANLATVGTPLSGSIFLLPGAWLPYKRFDGVIDYISVPNTVLIAGRLAPEMIAERFRVFLSNGSTEFAAKDITDPNLILQKVRVQKRDGSFVDYEYTPQPAIIHTEAPATAPVLREYIAGATWSKPANLKEVLVYCWGGAGGGGTGRRQASTSTRSGGGSGPGSTLVVRRIPAALLGATEAITIGAGGVGGAAITSGNVNGNPGTSGGDSSFGSLVLAKGAGYGGGGTTGDSTGGNDGGSPALCIPAFGPWVQRGGIRKISATLSPGESGQNANNGTYPTASGASGGATWSGGGGVQYPGGDGGGLYVNGVLVPGPAGSPTNGSDGADGVSDVLLTLLDEYGLVPTYGPGTGGASSGGSIAGSSGKGGNGGRCAGGGGSGSGNTAVGKGGDGGGGLVYVVEIYT